MTGEHSRLPLDLLLLIVLVPSHTHTPSAYLVVVPLLLYVLLAIAHPLTPHRAILERGPTRYFFLARFGLLWIIIAAVVVVPVLTNVSIRVRTPIESDGFSPAYEDIHDGALQMESALRYLHEGKNPYAESYADTPIRFHSFSETPAWWANSSFDHLVYLPGYLLYSFPIFELTQATDLPYDQRLPYLMAFLLMMVVVPALFDAPTHKLAAMTGIGLNHLLVGPVIKGMNDVVLLLFVALTVLAIQRHRLFFSAILFGLACSVKQFAWLIAPFYFLYVWYQLPEQERARRMAVIVALMGSTAALMILPFFLWDPAAFWVDVITYAGGGGPNPYPVRGYTLGTLLVGAGVIESRFAPFPFLIFQIVLGLPLLFTLLYYQARQNRIATMLFLSSSFIFGFGFLSRFFQTNYLGAVTVLASLGLFLYHEPESIDRDRRAGPDLD